MSLSDRGRRTALKVLLALPLCLPAAGYAVHTWWSGTKRGLPKESPLTLKGALERLLFVIGPWPAAELEKAREYANLLISPQEVQKHRPHESMVIGLASRFRPDQMAVQESNLSALPPPERQFLVNFAENVYRCPAVLSYITKEAPDGACIGDPAWHTRKSP